MNPAVETGLVVFATIVVGITLLLVPVPRQKPPEIDKPPVEVPVPSPQEVVEAKKPDPQETEQHLQAIETKLLHIQQQVQRMEKKVE